MSIIVSAVAVLTVMVVTLMFGDYFFDLNDDVLMKDILSGAYTGAPEGRNIQMLYPISWFISLFYKTGINLDWYGIFLCAMQYLCLYLVTSRLCRKAADSKRAVLYAACIAVATLGFFWPHFLFVQYTFVCGMLSSTAAFLILLSDKEDKKDNYIALILILVAYLIRSEMLLLTLPMVGVAILIKWALSMQEYCRASVMSFVGEKKQLFRKYLGLCFMVAAGLIICTVIHKIAYSPAEWKEFNRFFDNRTELYDFQYIPDYAENKDFYDSVGLSESEQKLLENYNFALDDEINADLVGEVAEYAAQTKSADEPLSARLSKSMSLYIYRLHHVSKPKSYEYPMTDFPWNIGIIVLYIATALALFVIHKKNKHYKVVSCLLLITLLACRTVLWLYIIMRGRDPIRITHPLYLMELLILTGMIVLLSESKGEKSSEKNSNKLWFVALAIGLIGAASIPMQSSVINHENTIRQAMLDKYRALYDYFDDNKDNYYFIDVYTSVTLGDAATEESATFSEKMFDRVDNSFANHDLLGGWASKSPIYQDKLENAGFLNVQDALISDGVYFVQNKTSDTEWLLNYYREKGIGISIEQTDMIADTFGIYKLERVE